MRRQLILCAYDVSDAHRLAAALARVTAWSHGGQRSAFECLAARADGALLAGAVGEVLAPRADRLALLRPVIARSFPLGLGRLAEDTPLVYLG